MASIDISAPRRRARDGLAGALGLALLIIVAEYVARRFVLMWFPAIGARRVNDMIAAGLCYLGLIWLTAPTRGRGLADGARAVRGIFAQARRWQVWLAALVALVANLGLSIADAQLWGQVQLPGLTSPWRWDLTLAGGLALPLVAASMLLVNGLVIPFAEEWLWRGLIQPRLASALGFVPGLLLTALVFSLKHALVDASLGRLLAITGFGIVMGLLAARWGWRASALAHALTNTLATCALLAARGADA